MRALALLAFIAALAGVPHDAQASEAGDCSLNGYQPSERLLSAKPSMIEFGKIAEDLEKFSKKDEFENLAQFEERLKNQTHKLLVVDIKPTGTPRSRR